MNKKFTSFLILALLFMLNCFTPRQALYAQVEFEILWVPVFAQQERAWCWAASGEMIMTYFGKERNQCMLVNDELGDELRGRDCCQMPRPTPCLKTSEYLDFYRYDFTFEQTDEGKPLPWDELVRQIDCKKPVSFTWTWSKYHRLYSSGHNMVARGYIILDDLLLVIVNDPKPCNEDKSKGGSIKIMTYLDYNYFPEYYKHDIDRYDFRSTGGD